MVETEENYILAYSPRDVRLENGQYLSGEPTVSCTFLPDSASYGCQGTFRFLWESLSFHRPVESFLS